MNLERYTSPRAEPVNAADLVKLTRVLMRSVRLRSAGDAAGHEFHGNQWTGGSFSEDDRRLTVDQYTQGESNAVNGVLRGTYEEDGPASLYNPDDPDDVARVQEAIARMDAAMVPLRQRAELYRAVYPEFVDKLKIGDVYTDKGFVSTTDDVRLLENIATDINLEPGDMGVITIRAAKGTPAVDVNSTIGSSHGYAYQRETVLGRGLTYRVINKRGREIWVETSHARR